MRLAITGVCALVLLVLPRAAWADPCTDEVPSGIPPVVFQARGGIEVARTKVMICGQLSDGLLVRASPRRWSFSVEVQGDPERQTRTLVDYLRSVPGARAALSGGYLASFYPPLPNSLVKTGGRVVNRARKSALEEGMVCFSRRSQRVFIGPVQSDDTRELTDCVQAGPLLVMEGRAPDLKERKYPPAFTGPARRAFIAELPGGEVIMGIVESAALEGFAQFLARPASAGGLGARAAIHLSGSSSAGIALVDGESMGSTDTLLPDAIVLSPRN